jgi:hypothetical protein
MPDFKKLHLEYPDTPEESREYFESKEENTELCLFLQKFSDSQIRSTMFYLLGMMTVSPRKTWAIFHDYLVDSLKMEGEPKNEDSPNRT